MLTNAIAKPAPRSPALRIFLHADATTGGMGIMGIGTIGTGTTGGVIFIATTGVITAGAWHVAGAGSKGALFASAGAYGGGKR
jgi:hypothetical protein